MTAGRELVNAGLIHEAEVRAALESRGWDVVPFGQGTWNPEECVYGNARLLAAIRASTSPLRYAPDMLVSRGSVIRFVEVVHCPKDDRALELAKLVSDDEWSRVAPVYGIDTADWGVWRHLPYRWPSLIVDGPTRYTTNGSGDVYAWFTRSEDRPFREVF